MVATLRRQDNAAILDLPQANRTLDVGHSYELRLLLGHGLVQLRVDAIQFSTVLITNRHLMLFVERLDAQVL